MGALKEVKGEKTCGVLAIVMKILKKKRKKSQGRSLRGI